MKHVGFWSAIREDGLMFVDLPKRKIAVYPNLDGMVVFAAEEDGVFLASTIGANEVEDLIDVLQKAGKEAAIREGQQHLDYEIWLKQQGKE